MKNQQPLIPPKELPFLQAITWQRKLDNLPNYDEMLDLYERGWKYRGVLAEIEGQELTFLKQLAKWKHSWIVNEI
jgi:hypothetical protein